MRTPTSGDTMELERILNDLRDPGAYEHAIDTVEIVHTHASAVVLAGEHVYKLKKPVDLGFLDYSTLARRKHMCEREVELNRPRAPGVYLGVVPIVLRDGRARVGGDGETIEYAVHMQRLPDSATLSARVQHGELDPDLLLRIGRTIAAFHRTARRGPDVSRHATFDAVRTMPPRCSIAWRSCTVPFPTMIFSSDLSIRVVPARHGTQKPHVSFAKNVMWL